MTEKIADDMLHEAEGIAAFTGDPVRRVRHLLEKGKLPAFKHCGRWRMRKSAYLAYIARLEAAGGGPEAA